MKYFRNPLICIFSYTVWLFFAGAVFISVVKSYIRDATSWHILENDNIQLHLSLVPALVHIPV